MKAVVGERVWVEAAVFCDGHDRCRAILRHRRPGCPWESIDMAPLGNDRFGAALIAKAVGPIEYEVLGVVDAFAGSLAALGANEQAGRDVRAERESIVALVEHAAGQSSDADRRALFDLAARLREAPAPNEGEVGTSVMALVARHHDAGPAGRSGPFRIEVERVRARFSNWYELFPRSATDAGRHGTLRDVIDRLDYLAGLGVQICYLPPIHPIGTTNRKGANNAPTALPGDPGSPWAIGSPAGGHEAIHPELGTVDDFVALVRAAKARGMEIALDLALQCSPDHPWVREHPTWFRRRADGSIACAENPPKRYEDVYPLDFDTPDWRALWRAVEAIVEHWIGLGVAAFRVDNPHTKPFRFWEWLIASVRGRHPEVIFLAEAFTRPAVLYQLAKLGFSQSYTYFTWRNGKHEIEEYCRELTTSPVADYLRPNFWPNTPDILTAELQHGGVPAFALRALLAATLAPSWGIYGPVFELAIAEAREPGSEEYRDSDKYQVNHYHVDPDLPLARLVRTLNHARGALGALQHLRGLHFHGCANDHLLVYSRRVPDAESDDPVVLVVANLDSRYSQSGFVELDLAELGVAEGEPFVVTDWLSGASYAWQGATNFVILDPTVAPGHLFSVSRR